METVAFSRRAGKPEVRLFAKLAARAILLASLALAGCSGEEPLPYRLVTAAQPNPFRHAARFAVSPIEYGKLTVHGEPYERWAARQDQGKLAVFERDKDAMNQSFSKAFVERAHAKGFDVVEMGSPDAGPFVVEPIVRDMDPGVTSFEGSAPSGIKMRVVVRGAGGAPLDEIEVAHAGGVNEQSVGQQHLAGDAAAIAEVIADYLAKRVGGPP